MSTITRRNFMKVMAATSAAAATGLYQRKSYAAEFTLKYANVMPATHPLNIRAREMAKNINAQSKGRIDFQVFPNNQLGGDGDVLSQLRSGAIDFFSLSPLVLGTLVPAAQISGVGFAFKDHSQVWSHWTVILAHMYALRSKKHRCLLSRMFGTAATARLQPVPTLLASPKI